MHKMKYGIAAAKLRKKIPFRAKVDQTTIWTSFYIMLKRFNDIKDFIKSRVINDVTKNDTKCKTDDVMKKRRFSQTNSTSTYIDVNFIFPSSVR